MTHMKTHTATHLPLPNVAEITCMDPSGPPAVAEKVCKTVRLLCFLIQNGVSKSNKVMQDMQVAMKRGKNIGKALNEVVARHHEALTCRSRDAHMSFVSPMEYQFSCSGSPPRPSQALSQYISKRKLLSPATTTHSRRQQHARDLPGRAHRVVSFCRGTGNVDTLVVEPGLSHYCPMARGRRVKITESSASMLSDAAEKDFHVDEAAEEFIERFYRELRLQKWLDHH